MLDGKRVSGFHRAWVFFYPQELEKTRVQGTAGLGGGQADGPPWLVKERKERGGLVLGGVEGGQGPSFRRPRHCTEHMKAAKLLFSGHSQRASSSAPEDHSGIWAAEAQFSFPSLSPASPQGPSAMEDKEGSLGRGQLSCAGHARKAL